MISIIVPVYNAEKYLDKCINSIIDQSYRDFEVLLIDDGSSDGSAEICDTHASKDPRIRVIHKSNGGSASARNLGLKLAKGDYIAFVDADDYVDPDYLRIMYELALAHHADIVQCQYRTVQQNEQPSPEKYAKQESHKEIVCDNIQLLRDFCQKKTYVSVAVLWNKLYRRELFDHLEFVEKKGIDDEFLIYRLIYLAKKIVKTTASLYYYYMSPNSQMRSAPSLKKLDSIIAIEEQLEFFKSIGHMELHNMLLYRHYSGIADSYHYVKKYFPEEKDRLQELKEKKKSIPRVLTVKEVPVRDKFLLLMRSYCPRLFAAVHRKVKNT